MKQRPRIGRPPLAKRDRKGRLLSVRFSDEERRSLEQAAKQSQVSLSEWARATLLHVALNKELVAISSASGNPPTPPL